MEAQSRYELGETKPGDDEKIMNNIVNCAKVGILEKMSSKVTFTEEEQRIDKLTLVAIEDMEEEQKRLKFARHNLASLD